MTYPLLLRRLARILKRGSWHSNDYRAYRDYLLTAPPGPYARGACNITFDFELSWSRARRGSRANSGEELHDRGERARAILPAVLSFAAPLKIPITFAVVAHVATGRCDEHMIPPPFQPSWLNEDWYACDPHTDLARDPLFYGNDLIAQIRQSPLHEIASHGFSHVDLGDESTPAKIADFEIRESHRLLKKIDPALRTFVFPKNHPAFLADVASAGYAIYRGNRQGAIERNGQNLWRFPLGLWISPLSASPQELLRLVDIAMKRRLLVNFWCHGYEFQNPDQAERFFGSWFGALRRRAETGLAIGTMRDIIRRYHE